MRGEGRVRGEGRRDGGEKSGKGRSRQSVLMSLCRSIAWKVHFNQSQGRSQGCQLSSEPLL